jgi:hypothetical protein
MTGAGLGRALGMLLPDAAFCERFFLNPSSATWEAGLPLSPIGRRETDPGSQP